MPDMAYWWQQAPCVPPFGPTRETGAFAQSPPPESVEETDGVEGGASGGGNGGDGGGAVYTHTSAVTPDGTVHEPIRNSLVLHPGMMSQGVSHEQMLITELEWTVNESEPPQPVFELLCAPLQ